MAPPSQIAADASGRDLSRLPFSRSHIVPPGFQQNIQPGQAHLLRASRLGQAFQKVGCCPMGGLNLLRGQHSQKRRANGGGHRQEPA